MKLIGIFASAFLLGISLSSAALSDEYVQGYTRKDGTYVPPHHRSSPDSNPYNNYGYPGNTNPYTGKVAPGNPDSYLQRYNNNSYGSTFNNNTNPYQNRYRNNGRQE